MSQIDWGPVASWVASVLTAGTFFMTITLLKRDRLDRRRQQAAKVNAWIENVDIRKRSLTVGAHNASDAPVYDFHVNVYVLINTHPFYYRWYTAFNPHNVPSTAEAQMFRMKDAKYFPEEMRNPPLSIPAAVVTLSFTDTSGTSWHRSPSGQLKEEKKRSLHPARLLMDHYDAWPPFGKRDVWWVKAVTRLWFEPEILHYDARGRGWKFVRYPDWMQAKDEAFLANFGSSTTRHGSTSDPATSPGSSGQSQYSSAQVVNSERDDGTA